MCGLVEYARYLLHPEFYTQLNRPFGIVIGSAMATVALHVWNIPRTCARAGVTAFFAQISMPSILIIVYVMIAEIGMALTSAMGKLTETWGITH